MKIKKITYYKQRLPGQSRGNLSNKCEEGSKFVKGGNIRVGSCACDECPLFWFKFKGFVICHTEKKLANKEPENETSALYLVKDEGKNA